MLKTVVLLAHCCVQSDSSAKTQEGRGFVRSDLVEVESVTCWTGLDKRN